MPHPAVERVQTPRPRAISRNAFTCLLASAKIGEDTRSPTYTQHAPWFGHPADRDAQDVQMQAAFDVSMSLGCDVPGMLQVDTQSGSG